LDKTWNFGSLPDKVQERPKSIENKGFWPFLLSISEFSVNAVQAVAAGGLRPGLRGYRIVSDKVWMRRCSGPSGFTFGFTMPGFSFYSFGRLKEYSV
jgi:hypothetical protein